MECNVERAQAEATLQEYLARTHAFTSNSKHSINFNQMLGGMLDPPFPTGDRPGSARGKASGGTSAQPTFL
jgi:hypothetical protein